MRNRYFGVLCVALMVGFSALVYGRLPAQLPTHWGINGEVDGYSSRFVGAALAPGITLLVVALGPILPLLDPNRARYAEFQGSYYLILNAIALFMVVLHVATLGFALGWPIQVVTVVQVGVGLLFATLGNEMGRIKPNWFIGIRTPWTLANEEVWRRTHRASGRLMTGVGLVLALVVPFLPEMAGFVATMVGIVGFVAFSIGYSYLLWRRTVRA